MSELTAAEVRCHTKTSEFSASFVQKKDASDSSQLIMSWVHTRGRLEKGSGDSGKDLVMMVQGEFPQVVLSGVEGLSEGAVFSPNGTFFVVQTKDTLLLGNTDDLTTSHGWVTLMAGESFTGRPVWVKEDRVLFGVSGGAPKRDRLFCTLSQGTGTNTAVEVEMKGPLFVAEHGGALLSWDHSQEQIGGGEAKVAIVHRLANAMLAEIVMVALDNTVVGRSRPPPKILALDCRQEYCPPQVGFLASGALLLRLNALCFRDGSHVCNAQALQALPQDASNQAKHGLWVIEDLQQTPPRLTPVDVMPEEVHGSYDCYSGMYGRPGAVEGFKMDRTRHKVVATARHNTAGKNNNSLTYSDDLFELELSDTDSKLKAKRAINTKDESGKGCKIPVAIGEDSIIYHHRSPTESGDLWKSSDSNNNVASTKRLTKTMPLSLQRKLLVPEEVTIFNKEAPLRDGEKLPIHAQIFTPPKGDGDNSRPLQPLLWLHGGPMAQYSFDCNPLLSWLASCGYLVMVPNFSGSTGNGLEFMNRVLAEGCGVTDLSDCLACATYLQSDEAQVREPRLDLSRGIAVGGHSWGGYLAFMCMLQQQKNGESVFSCGIAAAGITDWFVQQRHTEVRYYDYALMGGWVYDKTIAARARDVSPISKATELRAPLLVLHGDQDIDVPFQQIPPFVEAAKRSPHPGASVEYQAYKGEGHGMAGTETQVDYLKRVKTFLRINLKPWDFTDNPHGEVTAY
eukprot:CAMPEP_0194371742 /NCGR_PEP_ID=MMETSP0174-20130528/20160_1 /TAXON_ID=216777 /ORGANISM="Proboscia alata, Strain PI-D3" /LENGTH=735 /DNA_ID=CAMNT_0039149965 /DNA_START=137 /DNA_END=2344 /DNA_ORIENTATION=-